MYLALKYPEKCVFFREQHHSDKKVSINCIVVCATRGYINAAYLWGSGSRCICRYRCYKISAFCGEMFIFLSFIVT